jgi:hypothetical protein
VSTQAVINRKHLGLRTALGALQVLGRNLLHGQTNFARMLWKFSRVYNVERQLADHRRHVEYELPIPQRRAAPPGRQDLYIHTKASAHPRRQAEPEPEPDGV